MKKAFAFKIVCSCVTPENIWRNRFCWLCFRPAETDVPLKTSEDYSKEESVTTTTENKTTTAKTTAQTPTMATTAGGERYSSFDCHFYLCLVPHFEWYTSYISPELCHSKLVSKSFNYLKDSLKLEWISIFEKKPETIIPKLNNYPIKSSA